MPHPAGRLYEPDELPPCKRCDGTRWSIEQDWTGWTASCLRCGNVLYTGPTLPFVRIQGEPQTRRGQQRNRALRQQRDCRTQN